MKHVTANTFELNTDWITTDINTTCGRFHVGHRAISGDLVDHAQVRAECNGDIYVSTDYGTPRSMKAVTVTYSEYLKAHRKMLRDLIAAAKKKASKNGK